MSGVPIVRLGAFFLPLWRRSGKIWLESRRPSSTTVTKLKTSGLKRPTKPTTPDIGENNGEMTFVDGQWLKLPPLLRSVHQIKSKYPDCVVLTQVGSFYELYFDHASEFSEKLGIRLATKAANNVKIPMAGFPIPQLEKYLEILVRDLHEKVVVVDQMEGDPDAENGLLQRRVSGVISLGTLTDERFIDSQENNFLLYIKFPEAVFEKPPVPDTKVGLAWLDLSVGSLYVQEVTLEELISTITRVKPAEILCTDERFHEVKGSGKWHTEFTEFQKYFINHIKHPSRHKTIEEFYYMFDFPRPDLKRSFEDLTVSETAALRGILYYVEDRLPSTTISLQLPEKQHPSNLVFIDSRTSEALELHMSMRNRGLTGSLYSAVRRTVTPGGSRLLSLWLSAPSRDLVELKKRQTIVQEFVKSTSLRINVVAKLKQTYDVNRILQRFALGKGFHLDLVKLAHSIKRTDELEDIIRAGCKRPDSKKAFAPLLSRFVSQRALADEILDDLDEDAIMIDIQKHEEEIKEELHANFIETDESVDTSRIEGPVFTVRPHASRRLKSLHKKYKNLIGEKQVLQRELFQKLVAEGEFKEVSLKITLKGDFQVYVKGKQRSDYDALETLMPEALEANKTKNTRWLWLPKWKEIGQGLQATQAQIQQEEQVVLRKLRLKVLKSSIELRRSAQNIEYIDVISSFATLSVNKDLVCPTLDDSTTLDIVRGRHIVAEEGLKRDLKNYVPNDCHLTEEKKKWVITGPNMGGKSTFLRQNAIIVILAQMGCFVPAQSARVGLVDKIFSRVGFNDDMINQLSTFMVEMLEVTYILRGATEKSLAILDEVGRGTSGNEGVAIAFSALHHLDEVNKSRVLFATHFGKEISDLLKKEMIEDHFAYRKTSVLEEGDVIRILYRLEDGYAERSYAIDVAKAAGYPSLALEKASSAYQSLIHRK